MSPAIFKPTIQIFAQKTELNYLIMKYLTYSTTLQCSNVAFANIFPNLLYFLACSQFYFIKDIIYIKCVFKNIIKRYM